MGSLVESHWWSVLKNIRWYNLIKTYMRKIWLNLIKTYQYRWLNISMLRINSTEWKLRWGRVKMYFGGNLWKWILLPLASSWQLMPDSGMASKVAIWVGSDKVKQLRIPRSDSPVNLALKLCRMFWCLWNHPKTLYSRQSWFILSLNRLLNISVEYWRIIWEFIFEYWRRFVQNGGIFGESYFQSHPILTRYHYRLPTHYLWI